MSRPGSELSECCVGRCFLIKKKMSQQNDNDLELAMRLQTEEDIRGRQAQAYSNSRRTRGSRQHVRSNFYILQHLHFFKTSLSSNSFVKFFCLILFSNSFSLSFSCFSVQPGYGDDSTMFEVGSESSRVANDIFDNDFPAALFE